MSGSGGESSEAGVTARFELQAATLLELVEEVETALVGADLAFGHGTDNARDEAAWLVLEALGRSPVEPVADVHREVAPAEVAAVRALLAERMTTRRPLAYITGRAWFAGLELRVDERSLVPRSPMAEMILGRFAPWLRAPQVRYILDIGTGGGCIAVACACAFPEAEVDAADVDPAALELARENIARHGLSQRVHLRRADVFTGLPPRRYDLIVANPPYVDGERMAQLPAEYRHEPAAALAGGSDGRAIIDRILAEAGSHLSAAGLLVVETGGAGAAVEAGWPHLPFVWPELDSGDAGIFVLDAAALGVGAEAGDPGGG